MAGHSGAGHANGIDESVQGRVDLSHDHPGTCHSVNGDDQIKGDNKETEINEICGGRDNEKENQETAPPPIAIVGMGMRLPGGVTNASTFWDLLLEKKDGHCRVPTDRYNIDAFYSPIDKPGTIKTRHGYFLDDVDLHDLDTSFFPMSKTEAEQLDPQQRLLLEVVWECMENAGQTGWRGQKVGCFVGAFGEDWLDLSSKDTMNIGMYHVTGSADFALANRISYEYNLSGPSMTIRTGCSASLVGLHEACQAIYQGECMSAIVAGSNLILTPTMTIGMSGHGVLSASGTCKTFDAKADGYGRGEAINAVYIKKLSDALRDKDPIQAVIRATATNCDGKTPSLPSPSAESHESVIRRVYEVAKIREIGQTAFVECHGTGTIVGDPLEAVAIANVFGDEGVFIGSVKPNVGHSEGASGTTSLIKAALALKHKTIPPNINFSEPNPNIPFEQARLQVPLEATPWPQNRHERVSINAFGVGGANAHVVLDSAASFGILPCSQNDKSQAETRPHLLVFSANHADSLRRSIEGCKEFFSLNSTSLEAMAHTLGARRQHLGHRAFCVTDGTAPLEVSPVFKSKSTPQVVFVFTGQGAQWAGMGKELMEDFATFREDIKAMDRVLAHLSDPPSWTIQEELAKQKTTSRLSKAEFSQPLCTAVQIALVNLLQSWNVFPAAVAGHSSGEIAAAYASRAITADAAIIIAYFRGRATRGQLRPGGMAAIGMGRDSVNQYMTKGVTIACENSPESVTLSGDKEPLKSVVARILTEQPEIFARHLKVEMAYHSYHMQEIGDDYQMMLEGQFPNHRPVVPFFSSVTGKVMADSENLGPSYWRKNLESPVLFYTAMQGILEEPHQDKLLLEIGPHSALRGPLRQIFKATEHQNSNTYIPTMLRDMNCTGSLLTAVGQMHLQGVPINFDAVTPGENVLTGLPNYPWRHDFKYSNEGRMTREWRLRRFARHELLGSRTLESNELEPTWRNLLRLEDVPWIQDHVVDHDIVFPAAGYVAMAGEAIRQSTGINDFTLRNVMIKAALVMQHLKTVEMITAFHPGRLTNELDSAWFEFSIVSHDGTSWTKNCSGQVRGGSSQTPQPRKIEKLARNVPASPWYKTMRRVGLNYGPEFQGLTEITASPSCGSATAIILDRDDPSDNGYQIHPTTMDLCLQVLAVGMSRGNSRRFTTLCVPTSIEELYIHRGSPKIQVEATASANSRGEIRGDALAMADGEVVMHLKQCKLSPLGDADAFGDADTVAGAQLFWKPDIDFVPADCLMRRHISIKNDLLQLERLTLLCILETRERILSTTTEFGHLNRFHSWLDMQASRAESGGYHLIEGAKSLASLEARQRRDAIDSAWRGLNDGSIARVGGIIVRVLEHCEAIFEGRSQPLEILIQDDDLTFLYQWLQERNDYRDFLALIGHSKPGLRILEIGAGTGGITATILEALVSENGTRTYSDYHYTDISAGFFVKAKERFKDYNKIEYAVLDISEDPLDQGFAAESYDLIVASNVLHATPSIVTTLRNVRKLLHPQGRLFLQELTTSMKMPNYIMGILPGWWLGGKDGRPDEPYISLDRWDKDLREAGFSGTDTVLYDDDTPHSLNAIIVSKPAETVVHTKEVTILRDADPSAFSRQVEAHFIISGFKVTSCTIDQIPPSDQDIVSLLDLTTPFFNDISAQKLRAFQSYVGRITSSGIFWVTRSAQVGCEDPRYSQILGVARTIRSELLIDFATLEIDRLDDYAVKTISQVFGKFQRRSKSPDLDPDWEFATYEGSIQIPRYDWISVPDALSVSLSEELPRRLEVHKPGQLQSMRWVQQSPNDLASDDVEVEIRAVGLNFKDILASMGIFGGTEEGVGLEGSGIVRHLGSGVKNLNIGDRVLVLNHGCFSDRLVTSSNRCEKIPDSLSFEEAATIPCVFATVIHSLLTVGVLEKGQTILIQSACGGVGLAAIQISRMIGAEIYATVGNDEKVQYLMETFGLPRHRIFNSRDSSFLQDLMRETDGRGADIVLNSLSGDLLHASWECVADFGKMLEIGKRDFVGQGLLRMDLFEANRTFFGIDLAHISVQKPKTCQRLLEQCMEYYQRGDIFPITPMKVFDAAQTVEAFRWMQKGQHIGKIVVSMPKTSTELEVTATKHDLRLRAGSSYLLVGGLGGLGRAISNWMVERGAKHLVYLSRSAGKSDEDQSFFNELNAQGCSVQFFAGSVINLDDVRSAVREAAVPIAGVMHMSMVLKDRALLQCTHEDWQAAIEPKVRGAWNLHEALAGVVPLDFFLLFGSITGTIGTRGQGNYAAANCFLDSFVQYRHGLGQPASVLNIGIVEDIGYVSEDHITLDQIKRTSMRTLHEQDLLDALQIAMTQCTAPLPTTAGYANSAQTTIGLGSTTPLSDPNNHILWKRDMRMSLYRNIDTAIDTGVQVSDGLKDFLARAASQPSILKEPSDIDYLTREIGAQLYSLTLNEVDEDGIDLKQSPASLGMDSLVAIEIRNWWRHNLGLEISVLEMMGAGSIEQLGQMACEGLRRKYEGDVKPEDDVKDEEGTSLAKDPRFLMKAP